MNRVNDESLADAVARHGVELDGEQIAHLDRYCHALWEWNEKLNLTRHLDYERFVARDVVDSLWLERFLESGESVLDVGSGGGVPGAILAIARPDLQLTLCDSVAKKAKALADIVRTAEIPARVVHASAQEVLQGERFDTLVVRAVAPLAKILTWFNPLWDRFSRLLLIKGPAWVEERAAARERRLLAGLRLSKLAAYPLPDSKSESVVLDIRPTD